MNPAQNRLRLRSQETLTVLRLTGFFLFVQPQTFHFASHSNLAYIFQPFSNNCGLQVKSTKELVRLAIAAKKHAFAAYSNFRVGAALLATDGRIYTGCNIENSSYGLTMCAERTAIFKAISEGERNFKAIAVVSDDPDYTPPCGACRQVLMDLAGNIDFIMVNGKGRTKTLKMKNFLPYAFGGKNLLRSKRKKS